MLQVAMGGEVISSSVVFEYKARDLPALPSSQHDWLSLDGEDTCFSKLVIQVAQSGVISHNKELSP